MASGTVQNAMVTRGLFHPLIEGWFRTRFGDPTPVQNRGWAEIAKGRDVLIAAPTGSGKTLAAFLWSIDRLVKSSLEGGLERCTHVVYVSPLKALGNDVHRNLEEPLVEIKRFAAEQGLPVPEISVAVRSGDTPASERQRMLKFPPHILITTPESFYILLTAAGSRGYLSTTKTVIVDEIHAIAPDKRGAHLSISLERLDALVQKPVQRIGLSATQKPVSEIARLLTGTGRLSKNGRQRCAIVDEGHRRRVDLTVETTSQELGPIATHELWAEIYDRVACLAGEHRTTLVFVNTRRLVERVAFQLTPRLGEGKVAAHHGSLSKRTRMAVEADLKSGKVPVVVSTASLELGIDIGHVDLVCHLGAPRSLATLLQRVGRSGHLPSTAARGREVVPKGILFPLTRDDLVQSAAAVRDVRAGGLDRVTIPEAPLDILAQQMVAMAASSEVGEEELWESVRRASPFQSLCRQDFDALLWMLSEGVSTRRGRRSAHLHHDRVNHVLRGRRGARLAAIINGGAIPDTADYDVVEEPAGTAVGKVNEDFAVESMGGDIFLLGNRSWRILRVEAGKVRVEDAQGAPPTIPFWLGEAPARTCELSQAVADLRVEVKARLSDVEAARLWLQTEGSVDAAGADQIIAYVSETVRVLGDVPSQSRVIAERFFDEAGGMQLVIHAPFGGRINRAWGLALRKRFCVTFDFELQAAATDDGLVLSLGEQHSFPLQQVFAMLSAHSLEADLVQALLQSPMFGNRWRWNATRALAVPRHEGGRRVPMQIQRMRAEDLLAAVFPEQVMCQTNRSGPIEVPDHPLVKETVNNCLHEAMDLNGLRAVIEAIERDEIKTSAVDTKAPSPMCHEILNSSPYTFLDDAPLEERRTRAVSLRRIDPELAKGIGALDPAVIDEVRGQSWPDVRNADELHDALMTFGFLPSAEAAPWTEAMSRLVGTGRATLAQWEGSEGEKRNAYVAAERVRLARAAVGSLVLDPEIAVPPPGRGEPHEIARHEAIRTIVRGWMEAVGPVTAATLADCLGLSRAMVQEALSMLEADGVVLQGRFTPDEGEGNIEWCERRILSRIHRLTIGKLRSEIEPVPAADFIRFLLRWQHVHAGAQLHGPQGILRIIGQLQGMELPAPAWENHVLPARIADYDPADLERLCLSGTVVWGRLSGNHQEALEESTEKRRAKRPQVPTRAAPLAFVLRADLPNFSDSAPPVVEALPNLSPAAREVARCLEEQGASFLPDIAKVTGRLPAQVEEALWELVAAGVATGDGMASLRSLLTPSEKRDRHRRWRARRGLVGHDRLMPVGRWDLLRKGTRNRNEREGFEKLAARQLLLRYGVIFRDLLARETCAPAWRALLGIYRQMEARGEVRGGRFVAGFVGEQFALPEAVETLRLVRRKKEEEETVIVRAADPLNLVGILTPGGRISPLANQAVVYSFGVPVEVGKLGAVRHHLARGKELGGCGDKASWRSVRTATLA